MNVLIAVASKHGSTREIAEAIANELDSAGLVVDLRAAGAIASLQTCDAIVLGSGIYAGSWLPEARSFVEQFHADLARLPVWVFSSGPLGADDSQPQHDPQQLAASLAGVPMRDHQIFVGKLDKRSLGLAERMIARVVGAPEGDFRDWEAIRAWAREIAAALNDAARSPTAA